MALIDPTQPVSRRNSRDETKHPGVCLLGLFTVIVGSALGVHLIFQALL